MSKYQYYKNRARDIAINWQRNDGDYCYSYLELVELQDYFYRLAKRYGLIREFRENCIPC